MEGRQKNEKTETERICRVRDSFLQFPYVQYIINLKCITYKNNNEVAANLENTVYTVLFWLQDAGLVKKNTLVEPKSMSSATEEKKRQWREKNENALMFYITNKLKTKSNKIENKQIMELYWKIQTIIDRLRKFEAPEAIKSVSQKIKKYHNFMINKKVDKNNISEVFKEVGHFLIDISENLEYVKRLGIYSKSIMIKILESMKSMHHSDQQTENDQTIDYLLERTKIHDGDSLEPYAITMKYKEMLNLSKYLVLMPSKIDEYKFRHNSQIDKNMDKNLHVKEYSRRLDALAVDKPLDNDLNAELNPHNEPDKQYFKVDKEFEEPILKQKENFSEPEDAFFCNLKIRSKKPRRTFSDPHQLSNSISEIKSGKLKYKETTSKSYKPTKHKKQAP